MSAELVKLPTMLDFPSYAKAIENMPRLTAEEEKALAVDFVENHDLKAAHTLVTRNMYLVIYAARKYLGYGLPASDLAQEGTIGLMKAIRNFDPYKGFRVSSYAIHWIEAEIKDFIISRWKMVKLGTSKALQKLFFSYRKTVAAIHKMNPGLQGDQLTQQVAMELKVTPEETREVAGYIGAEAESIEAGLETGSPLILALEDKSSDSADSAFNAIASSQEKDLLKQSLSVLSPKEKQIIEARFYKDQAETLSELSVKLGVSLERVRQLEKKALEKLKLQLQPA